MSMDEMGIDKKIVDAINKEAEILKVQQHNLLSYSIIGGIVLLVLLSVCYIVCRARKGKYTHFDDNGDDN